MAIQGFARAEQGAVSAFSPALDASQQAVVALGDSASASVIGAAGSGKTATIIELVADRVLARGWGADELIVLTQSRSSATALRDRIARRLGVPTLGPLARTLNSLAFGIVRDAAANVGAEPPRLLTGAEQDQIIADLLQGEIEQGTAGYWPEQWGPDIRRLRGFRTELRDLMMRAVEHGLVPQQLAAIGERTGRSEWVAAARFITVYDEVKASYRGRYFDSTELVQEAAALVRASEKAVLGRVRLVILDDAQEATEATLVLVRALAARGIAVIAFGDPDISTGAFRGAIPEFLGRFAAETGIADAQTMYLESVHRHSGQLRELASSIIGRIGAAGAGQQRKAPGVAAEQPEAEESQAVATSVVAASAVSTSVVAASVVASSVVATSAVSCSAVSYCVGSRAEEIALIARRLRERHVLDGVPWGEMAVIVRTGVSSLSQSLQALEVQTEVSSARVAVRDEYSVRALVLLLELALGRVQLDAETAVELMLGPIGGLDAVSLRRLKAALRHEEFAGSQAEMPPRSGAELLADALRTPNALATIDTRVGRAAVRVADNLRQLAEEAASGATIEELLWGAWQRSGLESQWFERSMSTGLLAEEANRHLDAVVVLFSSAKRFVERTPDAAPSLFLDGWLGADVPEDTLAPRQTADAVAVGTPSSMIGREFQIVVVAGLQENVWPNLRLRGSLLGAQDLAATLAGEPLDTADRRREVLHDELRLFAQAVTRARSELVVTAVASEDSLPSAFLRLVPAGDPGTLARHPLSLRGMVGKLRRELTADGSFAAASALARLAAERVPGAEPSSWYGLNESSTTEPLVDLTAADAEVRISPSRMEAYETCALHWLIGQVGGSSTNTAANLGTIIHAVAEEATDYSPEALFAAVEKRWGELQFEAKWQSEVQKATAQELTTRLSAYLRDTERAGGTLLASEASFDFTIGHARLRGKIDRVEGYPDGTAVIVDLKTGKNDPVSDDAVADNPQLGAYQLAFASGAIDGLPAGLAPGGAKLVIVSKASRGKQYAEPRQAAFTAGQLEEFAQRVIEDAAGMAGNVFVAEIGTHCLDPWSYGSCGIHVVRSVSS